MSTTEQPAYAFPATVLQNRVQGEMVLLDLATERYFGLDEVGAAMVSRFTEQPLEQAYQALAQDYEVDVAVLRRDGEKLLASLLDAGLLQRVAG